MPRFPRNIVLIGMRGSGKSAVGALLAERLGRHFNDTDEMLEDWEGLPIAQVFTAYGEPYFR
ncbi:MAG: shikimate kinase, partial [Planctomycetota bacterium]